MSSDNFIRRITFFVFFYSKNDICLYGFINLPGYCRLVENTIPRYLRDDEHCPFGSLMILSSLDQTSCWGPSDDSWCCGES